MNLFDSIGKAIFGAFKKAEESNNIIEEIESLSKSLDSDIKFFKDRKTGNLRWIAAWSSNYLDDDIPPDIISEQSHKDFIERVEKGLAQYPELWHWHTEGTKWGITDWLAYDEDCGIVWASGTIDEGHEKEALALIKSKIELGVSHGMKDIVRSPVDKKVIAQHTTYEISDLPLRWAANKMTALFIAGNNSTEVNMTLSNEKKQYLRDAGLPEEEVENLDAFGAKQAEKFSNRAQKEKEESSEPEEKEAKLPEETKQETVEGKQENENADLESEKAKSETGEETEKPEDEQKSGEEVEKPEEKDSVDQTFAIKAMIEASFEQFGDGVIKALEKIEARVAELEKANKSREKREKEKALQPLSTSILERLSSIGAKETELDESDDLLKQKPVETEAKKDGAEASSFSEFLAKNLFNE